MDGLTAIRTIREMEARGETTVRQTGEFIFSFSPFSSREPDCFSSRFVSPVFALTGNARQFQIDQALASGMDDVILKVS